MPEKYSKILEEGKNVRKKQFSGIFTSISDIFYSKVNFMTFWTPEINNLRYSINLTFVIIGIFWHFRALVNFLTLIWPWKFEKKNPIWKNFMNLKTKMSGYPKDQVLILVFVLELTKIGDFGKKQNRKWNQKISQFNLIIQQTIMVKYRI